MRAIPEIEPDDLAKLPAGPLHFQNRDRKRASLIAKSSRRKRPVHLRDFRAVPEPSTTVHSCD